MFEFDLLFLEGVATYDPGLPYDKIIITIIERDTHLFIALGIVTRATHLQQYSAMKLWFPGIVALLWQ